MAEKADTGYPSHYETEALLKDGSRMRLRPIAKEDTDSWLAFVFRLSTRTKYLRFHSLPERIYCSGSRL